jgi:hypothetical protein
MEGSTPSEAQKVTEIEETDRGKHRPLQEFCPHWCESVRERERRERERECGKRAVEDAGSRDRRALYQGAARDELALRTGRR